MSSSRCPPGNAIKSIVDAQRSSLDHFVHLRLVIYPFQWLYKYQSLASDINCLHQSPLILERSAIIGSINANQSLRSMGPVVALHSARAGELGCSSHSLSPSVATTSAWPAFLLSTWASLFILWCFFHSCSYHRVPLFLELYLFLLLARQSSLFLGLFSSAFGGCKENLIVVLKCLQPLLELMMFTHHYVI